MNAEKRKLFLSFFLHAVQGGGRLQRQPGKVHPTFLSPINCADQQQKLTYCQYFCLTQTRYAISRFSAALSSELCMHWYVYHSCVHVREQLMNRI